jgi:micrococcal nuclease
VASRATARRIPFAALIAVAMGLALTACEPQASPPVGGLCYVTRVVDGDTAWFDCLDQRVRFIGVDAPEVGTSGGRAECFGDEATAYVEQRLSGVGVRLEAGVRDRDQYGRPLRYLWLGTELLNETLVREGFARVYRASDDRRYHDRLLAAEAEARAEGRGLWSACAR